MFFDSGDGPVVDIELESFDSCLQSRGVIKVIIQKLLISRDDGKPTKHRSIVVDQQAPLMGCRQKGCR